MIKITLHYKNNESIYEEIFLLVDFYSKINHKELENLKIWLSKMPDFEINGQDIIKLGIIGSQIKITINNLYEKWIRSDCKMSKNELIGSIATE